MTPAECLALLADSVRPLALGLAGLDPDSEYYGLLVEVEGREPKLTTEGRRLVAELDELARHPGFLEETAGWAHLDSNLGPTDDEFYPGPN